MSDIALVGASGYTGQLIRHALATGRRHVRLVVREPSRLASISAHEEVREADVTDPLALRRALDGATVVINAVGPFMKLGPGVVDAAIDVAAHYLDITGEQAFVHWLLTHRHQRLVDRSLLALPAFGFDFVPGQLAAGVAAQRCRDPSMAHVAYAVGRSAPRSSRTSRGTRTTVASMLGTAGLARVDGALVEQKLAQARRLAWFPRPVGPRQVASVPAVEALLLDQTVPTLTDIATYFAATGRQAEFMQAASWLSRFSPVRSLIARRLARANDPTPQAREATRWSVVAEVGHAAGDPDPHDRTGPAGAIRSWVTGTDPYGFTAHAVALAVDLLKGGEQRSGDVASAVALADSELPLRAIAGVVGPLSLASPEHILDDLARRCGLRWGVSSSIAPEA